jgi:hypothetical protein
MDVTEIPRRISKQYLATLTDEQREFVEKYKEERRKKLAVKAVTRYRQKHRDKVNECQNKRNRMLRETQPPSPKKVLRKKIKELFDRDDEESKEKIKRVLDLLSSDGEDINENNIDDITLVLDGEDEL